MNKQMALRFALVISFVLFMTAFMAQPLVAQTSKGIELCNSGQLQEAEKVLRDALKANPKDIQANYWLGIAVLLQDKHEEALKIFLKTKEDQDKAGKDRAAEPKEYQLQIALARAHLELRKNDEALKNLEAAKKINANGPEINVYRGLYYINAGNMQKAIAELEKAISLNKNEAYAYYYAGRAYLLSGNAAKAKEMWNIFLQLAPRAPEAPKAKQFVDELC
jgi:tetratricopeptide (TPR) repeat protein